MRIERSVEIAAAPGEVYEVVMDPARLDDWVTIHDHLEDAPNGQLKRGSKLTQTLRVAGQRFKVRWTVAEIDFCRRVVWEGRGPLGSHARVVYRFDENEHGTRFSYMNQYDLPGGVFGRMAGRAVSRVTEKELDGSLQKLKAMLE